MENESMFHVKHYWESFAKETAEFGIDLTDRQIEQLHIYYDELLSWNEKINLTAITELNDVLTKHYLDSLSITKILPYKVLNSGLRTVDVGTGAGFPGMVLAVCCQESRFILMDSLQKRVGFLNNCIEKTGLRNCTAVHARAEEVAHMREYRDQSDLVVSRAVADLSVLAEYDLPFLKIGGKFVAYKTEKGKDELAHAEKAIKLMGGRLIDQKEFYLQAENGDAYNRLLIMIEKFKVTPGRYPRKAGMPSKEPIQ
jgi:16S rRNA (guanine527-N7)-methyltransferase